MYHYKMCGLDNVWLENGYTAKETRYGKGVSVANADQLHALLATVVAKKEGRLTGKELKFLRNFLCLSQRRVGEMLGCSEQSVSLWERNDNVPVAEEALIRSCVLEKVNGNAKVSEMIDRMNTVDRLVHRQILARSTREHWTTTLTDEAPEAEVA